MSQSNPGIDDIHFDDTVRQSSKDDEEEEDIGAVSDLSSDGVSYESDVERINSSTMDDDAKHPSPVQMHNFGHGSNHTQIVTASNSSRGMPGADIICNRSRKSFSSSSQRSGSPLGVRSYAHLSSQESRARERGDNYHHRRNNRIAADALFSYEYNNLKQSALQQHNRSRSSSQRDGSNGSLNEINPLVDHSVGSWLRFRPYDEPEDRKSRFLSRASHAGQSRYVVRGSENISMIPNGNGFDPQSYNHIRHPEIVAYEERSQAAADKEDSHPTHFQYHHQGIQQIHQPDGKTHDGSSGRMTTVARIDERGRKPNVLPTMIENVEEHDMNRSTLNTFEHQARNNLDDVSFVEDDSNIDHKMPSQEPLMAGMISKLEGKSEGEANDSLHLQDISEVNRTTEGLTLSDQDGSLLIVEKGVRNEASNGSRKKISNATFSSGTMDKHSGSNDSKYETYECCVSHFQGDRSVEIPLFTFARPHMRAFHFAWMSFFVAFFTWFAISPLLNEIKNSLGLTKDQVFASSIYSSGGTIIYRLIAGPLCDRLGARWVMSSTLVISAIPVMATGLARTSMELNILRLVTGIAGSSFVTCIYWASMMFTREVSGTATALVSGWGNLGGGVTNLLMGSCFFPLFKWFFSANNDEAEAADRAWRTVCIIPAIPSFLVAYWIIKYSDDSPKGNFHKLWSLGLRDHVFAWEAFGKAVRQPNTWILTIHYACCFGVEVTMVNSAAFLFSEKFELQTESAAAIASIFGWMNLFARGMGGFISDIMNVKYKMRGRLVWHIVTLVAQGALIILFGSRTSLAGAIVTMTCFSFFVQTSEGSTYAIVPYVCPDATGSVAGIVGAGGNVGGVIFLMMIQKWDYKTAFFVMGVVVICSSILSLFLILTHQDALLTKPSGSHSGGSSNKD